MTRNEREHIWCDADGTPTLKHVKYTTPDGVKHFPWYTWHDFGNGIARWFKGIQTDTPPLLYPLPVFVAASRGEHVYIVEGEADQEAAAHNGLLAVTAGAAGAFGPEHARLFRGWRGRLTIVRDNDLPGAYGAAKTYAALRDVGIPASRLRVAGGRCKGPGADLRDHLDAGFTAEQLVSEPIAKVRKLAARATRESFNQAGYRDWAVVGAGEAAQLTNWKPVAP